MIHRPAAPRLRAAAAIGASVAADLLFSFLLFPHLAGHFLGIDGDGYGVLASTLLSTGTLAFGTGAEATVFRGPGYPVLLALVGLPAGGIGHAQLILLHTLLNAVTCGLLFRLARHAFDARIASIACAVWILHPLAHVFVPRYLADTLLAALLLGAVTSLLVPPSRRPASGLMLAVPALAAAALVKQVMLLFPPLLAAALWWRDRREDGAAGRALLLFAGPLLLVAPWTVRNALLTGEFIPVHTGGGFNLVVGNTVAREFLTAPYDGVVLFDRGKARAESLAGPEQHVDARDDAAWDAVLLRAGLDELMDDPWLAARKFALNIPLFFTLGTSRGNSFVMGAAALLVFPFVVLGLPMLIRNRTMRVALPAAAAFVLAHTAVYAIGRFSIPLLPVLAIAAALGIDSALRRWKSRRNGHRSSTRFR